MRVVEMDPSEKAPRPDPIQPRKRFVGHFVAGAIDAAERQRLVFRQVEIVEVGLESLRYAPFVIEHVRADEAARREPAIAQALGEGRLAVVEKKAAVVADAVGRRKLAGEDRRMSGQRERRRRDRLLEEDAFAREPIERETILVAGFFTMTARLCQASQLEMREADLRIDLEGLSVRLLCRVLPPCRARDEPTRHPALERRRLEAQAGCDAIERRIEAAR